MTELQAFSAGRVAVVTGAALGIGRAMARHFASLGMNVVLADFSGGDLDEAAFALCAELRRGCHDLCGSGRIDSGIPSKGQYRPGHHGCDGWIYGDDDSGCVPGISLLDPEFPFISFCSFAWRRPRSR